MTAVQDIDPFAPGLNATDRAMLMELIKARDAYCLQGRGREYHAVGKALQIVWHYLRNDGGAPELAATDFGALDAPRPVDEPRAGAMPRSFSAAWLPLTPDTRG